MPGLPVGADRPLRRVVVAERAKTCLHHARSSAQDRKYEEGERHVERTFSSALNSFAASAGTVMMERVDSFAVGGCLDGSKVSQGT